MRKLRLTLVVMSFWGFAQAQSFKITTGYGFPWMTQQIGTNTLTTSTTTLDANTNSEINRVTYTSQNVKGSYGGGWNIGGSYVHEFSKYLNLELGLTYSLGKTYTTESIYTHVNQSVVESFSSESETSKSRSFLFTPTLKFMIYDRRRRVTPYVFAGPVLSKVNFTQELKKYSEENGAIEAESRSTKFKGGIGFGIRAGGGLYVPLNKKFSFFSEVVFTGMNYYPKEGEITRYTINGEDNLGSLTPNVRNTTYVNKVTTDSQHTPDELNSPGKSLRFPVAMSSMSINVGILVKPR